MEALSFENRDIESLHLHVMSHPWEPAEQQQGALIGEVAAQIIGRGVVGVAAQELELPTPLIIPSAGEVVVLEVLVVEEVGVAALVGVETSAEAHLQGLQAVELVDVLGIALETGILRVGAQHALDAVVVV